MRSKLMVSIAGLIVGFGIATFPTTSQAFFGGGAVTCGDICAYGYHVCVLDRGLKAGCGREQRECLRICQSFGG